MGTLWSVLYFYCNWQISAKKKKTTTREWEGMGVIFPGVERDGIFPGEVWEFTPVSPSSARPKALSLFLYFFFYFTLKSFSASSLCRRWVFNNVSAEKPASHKYVVAKGINTFSACFDNPGYSTIAEAQKSTSDLFLKSMWCLPSDDNSSNCSCSWNERCGIGGVTSKGFWFHVWDWSLVGK